MCPFLCYPRKVGAFHNAFPILGSTGYHLVMSRILRWNQLLVWWSFSAACLEVLSCPRKRVGDASNEALPE